MLVTEAEDIMVDRVRFMTDAPNVLVPDDADDFPTPRYSIQRSSPDLSSRDMDGGVDGVAEILVRVETAEGDFSHTHTILLNQLIDLFPIGARFKGVRINEAPNPRGSFTESGVYVTPVFIRGRFYKSP